MRVNIDKVDDRQLENIRLEIEAKKETKGDKIIGLVRKHSELKSLLRELDEDRKEYSEANKKLEAERITLEKNIAIVAEDEQRFRDEAKGVKFAKGTTSKVIETRITHLKNEVRELEEHNKKLRDQINQKKQISANTKSHQQIAYEKFGDDEWTNTAAIKAKPRLFGECD